VWIREAATVLDVNFFLSHFTFHSIQVLTITDDKFIFCKNSRSIVMFTKTLVCCRHSNVNVNVLQALFPSVQLLTMIVKIRSYYTGGLQSLTTRLDQHDMAVKPAHVPSLQAQFPSVQLQTTLYHPHLLTVAQNKHVAHYYN